MGGDVSASELSLSGLPWRDESSLVDKPNASAVLVTCSFSTSFVPDESVSKDAVIEEAIERIDAITNEGGAGFVFWMARIIRKLYVFNDRPYSARSAISYGATITL